MAQRPANTIRQLKAKTSSCTLHDEEVKRLVHMVADREPEVKTITVGDKDGNVQASYCSILWRKRKHKSSLKKSDTATDVMAEALVESLDETVLKDGRRDNW